MSSKCFAYFRFLNMKALYHALTDEDTTDLNEEYARRYGVPGPDDVPNPKFEKIRDR